MTTRKSKYLVRPYELKLSGRIAQKKKTKINSIVTRKFRVVQSQNGHTCLAAIPIEYTNICIHVRKAIEAHLKPFILVSILF